MTEQPTERVRVQDLAQVLSFTLVHRLPIDEIQRKLSHYAKVFQTAPIIGESFLEAMTNSRQLIDEVFRGISGNPNQVEHTFKLALVASRLLNDRLRSLVCEALTNAVLNHQITLILDYLCLDTVTPTSNQQ